MIHNPHDDAIVIMAQVFNNNVYHMLIDNESSLDILSANAYD